MPPFKKQLQMILQAIQPLLFLIQLTGSIYSFIKNLQRLVFCLYLLQLARFLTSSIETAKRTRKNRKAKVLMQRDYPDLVSKLLLFLHAGLTIRASLEKIADDYQKNYRNQNLPKRPAYEALLETCHELKGGLSQPVLMKILAAAVPVLIQNFICTFNSKLKKRKSKYSPALRERGHGRP